MHTRGECELFGLVRGQEPFVEGFDHRVACLEKADVQRSVL